LSKDHERAKTLLNKAKLFKEKKDLAVRALNEVTEIATQVVGANDDGFQARLEEAENIYTEAIAIDPRNKGTNANLLADRAEVLEEDDSDADLNKYNLSRFSFE
jgi:hypothetical protein